MKGDEPRLHQIYIVDGPDCSGKTTLVDEMVKQLGAAKLHLTYRFKTRMDLYHRYAIERAIKMSAHQPVIIDRWWPSEITYAKAFRGGTIWPRNARAFDRIGRQADVRYIFCLPKQKERYMDAWAADRERRYAEKPWALKGRNQAVDDMSKVYDLYRDVLTWMDHKSRRDVAIYDRFVWDGSVADAVPALVSQLRYEWEPDMDSMLVIQPDIVRHGRHHVWPGVTWRDDQRVFDNFLEANGIPDHRFEFFSTRDILGHQIDQVTMMATLLTFRNPAILLDSTPLGLAKVLNATKHWPQTVERLMTFETSKLHLKSFAKKEVLDAAHRLGLA